MAPVLFISEYFEKSKFKKHYHRSSEHKFRRKHSASKKVPDWSLADNLAQKMFTRWRMPDVHLMATVMARKAPLYYAWTWHSLDIVQSTVLLPTIPSAGTSSGQGQGVEAGQVSVGGAMVAYQGVVQHSHQHVAGLQEIQVFQ
jgi:hypothetical protein